MRELVRAGLRASPSVVRWLGMQLLAVGWWLIVTSAMACVRTAAWAMPRVGWLLMRLIYVGILCIPVLLLMSATVGTDWFPIVGLLGVVWVLKALAAGFDTSKNGHGKPYRERNV
jgi:hypothetical protein